MFRTFIPALSCAGAEYAERKSVHSLIKVVHVALEILFGSRERCCTGGAGRRRRLGGERERESEQEWGGNRWYATLRGTSAATGGGGWVDGAG